MTEKREKNGAWEFLAVAMLFLFSGASSLIYQVIWTRQMVFVFGSTTFASATVLSSFMGGLALGSFCAGKFADRLKNPFLVYGILEGVIGLWALAAPFMFDAALPVYKAFWQAFHLQVLPFSILRFVVVAAILLVPTACMGATLPILSRFITTSIAVVGSRVGTLYSINTLGAVAGAIAGGFYLIPSFGLSVSNIAAACTNLALTAVVFLLAKLNPVFSVREQIPEAEAAPTPEEGKGRVKLPKEVIGIMIAFGISGAIAMIYEVAWTRALLMVIGSTTYAFSIMLSTFLLGIFLGSFVAARFADRVQNPVSWFSIIQIFVGISVVSSVLAFNYLPYLNVMANLQYLHDPNFGMYIRFGLAAIVLLPTALLLGATFPLAVKSCTSELNRLGRSVGTLYSVNTLGAIIGSAAAGFLIIPLIGGQQALITCAALNTVLGAALLIFCSAELKIMKILCALIALSFLAWSATGPQLWNLHYITASQKLRRGLNVNKPNAMSFEEWAKFVDGAFEILSWKDGICANVAVVRFQDRTRSLFTNGHIDASDGKTDMSTQALLPTIPLLLKPDAQSIADVGWGSGCTMGYALQFPIKKMVCAEIEPAVLDTSHFFHHVNFSPEKDSRLKIEFNDGRNYLLVNDEKYDVITSEPSNPWQAGVCNLYTKEYFQICHDRLKPGGIFAMWWQVNEVKSENLARVFAALKKCFKHLVIFETYRGDICACASDDLIRIRLDSVSKSLKKNPDLATKLQQYASLANAEDLAVKIVMSDSGLEKVISGLDPNTDDRNRIEFDVAKTYEQENFSAQNWQWLLDNSGPVWDAVDWSEMTRHEKSLKMAMIAERAMLRDSQYAEKWAIESYKTEPNSYAISVQALIDSQKKGNFESAFKLADIAVKKFPGESKPLGVRGIISLMNGAPLRARADFQSLLKLDPENKIYRLRLAQTYMPELREWYQVSNWTMPDLGKADTDAKSALNLLAPVSNDMNFLTQNPIALGIMGCAHLQLGDLDRAGEEMTRFLRLRPDDIQGLKILSEAYKLKNNKMGEGYCNQRVVELSKVVADKLCQNAQILVLAKEERLALAAIRKSLEYSPGNSDAIALLRELGNRNSDAKQFLESITCSSAFIPKKEEIPNH